MQQSFDASSAILIKYIENHPQRKYDVARAWWMHSYNLLEKGLLEEALVANETSLNIRQALRSDATPFNYLRQAEIFLIAKDYESAFNATQRGMELMIDDGKLYAELNFTAAVAINGLGHYDEALTYAQTALDIIIIELGKQHPLYSKFLYKTGLLLLSSSNYDTAHDYFRRAYLYSDNWFLSLRAYLFAIADFS